MSFFPEYFLGFLVYVNEKSCKYLSLPLVGYRLQEGRSHVVFRSPLSLQCAWNIVGIEAFVVPALTLHLVNP